VGTGFFADAHGSVLTASQVVKQAQPAGESHLKVRRSDGSASTTPSVRQSGSEVGVAVVGTAMVARPLQIAATGSPIVGESVIILGINLQSGIVEAASAEVAAEERDGFLRLSLFPTRGGYAGAPVLNTAGAVVGMIWLVRDHAQEELVALMLPASRLIYALEGSAYTERE
jgi:S1-C subfamily serine protease